MQPEKLLNTTVYASLAVQVFAALFSIVALVIKTSDTMPLIRDLVISELM